MPPTLSCDVSPNGSICTKCLVVPASQVALVKCQKPNSLEIFPIRSFSLRRLNLSQIKFGSDDCFLGFLCRAQESTVRTADRELPDEPQAGFIPDPICVGNEDQVFEGAHRHLVLCGRTAGMHERHGHGHDPGFKLNELDSIQAQTPFIPTRQIDPAFDISP